MKNLNFDELNLSPEIIKAIKDMGFEEASPIQSQAIPILLEGKDVIGQAQTGTGKTVAFGIPILEKIDEELEKLQAIILCPTRELTIQVAEEFSKLTKYKRKISVVPIYGGQSIDRQIKALKKGPQIVIGTPGRVIDHLNRHTLKMENVSTFVLDEADEMLNMGFVEDIELILEKVPDERQTVFFSATMPKRILELTKKYQKDPQLVKVVHQELTVPNIEQLYFEIRENMKLEVLSRLVDVYNIKLGLIFCNTKRKVDELVEHLQARGYSADSLHGDMRQGQRELIMKRFKSGNIELLVATDVAARGIDVDDVEAVFNYDIPHDDEYYVHRIGRTGRAGKAGRSFTFVVGREIYKLRDIEKYAKTKITYKKIPSFHDVEEIKISAYIEKIKAILDDKESKLEKHVNIIESMMEENYNAMDIAAALLKMNLGLNDGNKVIDDIANFNTKISAVKKTTGKKARLFISLGRRDNISPKDILGALAGETGIPGDQVGIIDIYDKFSFVDVPEEYAGDIIKIMSTRQIRGNAVSIEIAEKPAESDEPKRERSYKKPEFSGEGRKERPYKKPEFSGEGNKERSYKKPGFGGDEKRERSFKKSSFDGDERKDKTFSKPFFEKGKKEKHFGDRENQPFKERAGDVGGERKFSRDKKADETQRPKKERSAYEERGLKGFKEKSSEFGNQDRFKKEKEGYPKGKKVSGKPKTKSDKTFNKGDKPFIEDQPKKKKIKQD